MLFDDTSNPDDWDEMICAALSTSEDAAEDAWRRFVNEHVLPGRLMQLAIGEIEASHADLSHLRSCDSCRSQYDFYHAVEENDRICEERQHLSNGQLNLWSPSDFETTFEGQAVAAEAQVGGSSVPELLRKHLLVEGPVIMPGEEVALRTWQFGLITSMLKDSPNVGREVLTVISDAAFTTLQARPIVAARAAAIVCFGSAMHLCGINLATRFQDAGLQLPHVILAHDYYDPSLVCSSHELIDADVVVIVDVMHSGTLLRALIAACERFSPARVTSLVVIDQTLGHTGTINYRSLWVDENDTRIPLEQYASFSSEKDVQVLQRFEPNAECATQRVTSSKTSAPRDLLREIDPQLLTHVLATDALKCDHVISGKTYPFVVNVLDLLKRDDDSRQFITSASRSALADLAFEKTCIAFHSGRSRRAGIIAQALSSSIGWPAIPIGGKGNAFALTDQQSRHLADFDNVVIVDAAIRTGETLSAINRAVRKAMLFNRPRFIAFAVLMGLQSIEQKRLSEELGIELRSLFEFPLTPPTEEVRHWAKAQKHLIGEALHNNPLFESIQSILGDYCNARRQKMRIVPKPRSRSEQLELARRAMSYGRSTVNHAMDVTHSCHERSSRSIRHLPVTEVIHDNAMQSVLMGVLYNSVPAPLKESAVFGLAAAENYDWMDSPWLKCNQRFLSTTQAWKSVLLVECQMKLLGRESELTKFRNAAIDFRKEVIQNNAEPIVCNSYQHVLFSDDEPSEESSRQKTITQADPRRIVKNLEAIIEVAT